MLQVLGGLLPSGSSVHVCVCVCGWVGGWACAALSSLLMCRQHQAWLVTEGDRTAREASCRPPAQPQMGDYVQATSWCIRLGSKLTDHHPLIVVNDLGQLRAQAGTADSTQLCRTTLARLHAKDVSEDLEEMLWQSTQCAIHCIGQQFVDARCTSPYLVARAGNVTANYVNIVHSQSA